MASEGDSNYNIKLDKANFAHLGHLVHNPLHMGFVHTCRGLYSIDQDYIASSLQGHA